MATATENPFYFNSQYAMGSVLYSNASATTWAVARNATSGMSVYQSGTTNHDIAIKSTASGRGYAYDIGRSFIFFKWTSGSYPNITNLQLRITRQANASAAGLNTIVLKSTAYAGGAGSTLVVGDYSLATTTTYSTSFAWSNSTGAQNITLNSTAVSDANNDDKLNLALIDNDDDYSNVTPSAGTDLWNSIGWTGAKIQLNITYNSGYGHDVNGVLSANIGSINGIATADIGSMNGV